MWVGSGPISFSFRSFSSQTISISSSEAAKLKARFPIAYADTFAVATALKEGASIVTGDPDFKHVEPLVKIDWL